MLGDRDYVTQEDIDQLKYMEQVFSHTNFEYNHKHAFEYVQLGKNIRSEAVYDLYNNNITITCIANHSIAINIYIIIAVS